MINCGFFDISSIDIYDTRKFGQENLLSRFFLDIYLTDLDRFVFQKVFNLNTNKIFHFYDRRDLEYLQLENRYFVGSFVPIKSHHLLIGKGSSKVLLTSRQKVIFPLDKKELVPFLANYTRRIHYVRFLDYFVLGLTSTEYFCFNFNKNIAAFIRSHLRFDLVFNDLSLNNDSILIFATFNIKLTTSFQKNNIFVSKLKSSKKYFGKLMYRLEMYKKKFSKLVKNRLDFTLLEHFNKVCKNNDVIAQKKGMHSVWFYLFQVECLRAMQVGSLLFFRDNLGLFPSEVLVASKLLISSRYGRYQFSLYNLKLRLALKKVLKDSIYFEGASLNPIDDYMTTFFEEYKRRLFFIFNDIFLDYHFSGKRENFSLEGAFPKFFGVKSSRVDLLFLDKKIMLATTRISGKSKFFDIFANIPVCLDILRLHGFFHKSKFKPISNSSYLFLEDSLIIKIFGGFAYSFLNWFRCCFNLYSVKILVSLLKESCFITLSRKHNKTKSWVYNLYGNDLIILENLVYRKSFFPSSTVMRRMKFKVLLSKKLILFDELFFLD